MMDEEKNTGKENKIRKEKKVFEITPPMKKLFLEACASRKAYRDACKPIGVLLWKTYDYEAMNRLQTIYFKRRDRLMGEVRRQFPEARGSAISVREKQVIIYPRSESYGEMRDGDKKMTVQELT